MSESPCQVESLQRQIFAIDKLISETAAVQRFGETAQRFAVEIQPKLPVDAVLCLVGLSGEAGKAKERLEKLNRQRAKLVSKFSRARKHNCRSCPGRCTLGL